MLSCEGPTIWTRRHSRDGSHVVQLQPPLDWVATGDRDQAMLGITALLTQAIERQVRAEPAQWFWIHNRWKKQKGSSRAPDARRQ